ncbi:MAG TPA: hypothetical protein VGI74_13495 [Streptosporangiaceae bacterium]|jgi:hypothetical protein
MESITCSQPDTTRAAQLDRLATALSAYPDIQATVQRTGSGVPCLAVVNPAGSGLMSETVAVGRIGDDLFYFWSWGERITPVTRVEDAAQSIAYVLSSRTAQLDQ